MDVEGMKQRMFQATVQKESVTPATYLNGSKEAKVLEAKEHQLQ